MSLERFGVSMDGDLLKQFDAQIERAGYTSRSEAIRNMIRDYLVKQEWEDGDVRVVATVTLVYDHHARDLDSKLTSVQHDAHDLVLCSSHVHLDHHNCLEVVVLAGPADQVRELGQRLISLRGVKHGELTCTTTGGVL